ncbi:hypothetical protein VKI22_05505 [Cyanobacterium aponinum UTEX 3221]|uniref:PilW family protein n=1 Tax=Cyanobacterium aponinum TaxID=379064 RepID=UPI002B4C2342|nr:hypothetical protein [Cyanobacterium aponinum]WRL39545.1 hypothetical protein VKI22_05505 [Cyanobacterium aponinum UTEX 3221]
MKKSTLYRLILHNCKDKSSLEKGFSLIEAISTLLMGSIILGVALSGFFQIKEFFGKDKLSVDVNQRLRTAFQTIGPDLQQMGENVSNIEFPAVALSTNNGTSEITIRRGGLEPLTLCADISANSTDSVTVLDKNFTASPACISVNDDDGDGWPDTVKEWQNFRNGNTIRAYIVDTSTNKGEFFEYKGEETLDSGGATMTPSGGTEPDVVNLTTNSHTWANDYSAATTAIYLFDESTYKVTNNTLQLIRNGEVFDLVEDIEKLDVTAILQENPTATEYECKTINLTEVDCDPTFSIDDYTWNLIKSLDVEVTALPPQDKGNFAKLTEDDLTLSQQFLPRNRLNF